MTVPRYLAFSANWIRSSKRIVFWTVWRVCFFSVGRRCKMREAWAWVRRNAAEECLLQVQGKTKDSYAVLCTCACTCNKQQIICRKVKAVPILYKHYKYLYSPGVQVLLSATRSDDVVETDLFWRRGPHNNTVDCWYDDVQDTTEARSSLDRPSVIKICREIRRRHPIQTALSVRIFLQRSFSFLLFFPSIQFIFCIVDEL